MEKAYIQLFDDTTTEHRIETTCFEYEKPLTYEKLMEHVHPFLEEHPEFLFIKEIDFRYRFNELFEDNEISVGVLENNKWMEVFI